MIPQIPLVFGSSIKESLLHDQIGQSLDSGGKSPHERSYYTMATRASAAYIYQTKKQDWLRPSMHQAIEEYLYFGIGITECTIVGPTC